MHYTNIRMFLRCLGKALGEVEAPGIAVVSRSLEMFHGLFSDKTFSSGIKDVNLGPHYGWLTSVKLLIFGQMFLNSTFYHLCHLIVKIKFWMNHLWIKTIFQEDAAAVDPVTWSDSWCLVPSFAVDICFREIMEGWLLCLFILNCSKTL